MKSVLGGMLAAALGLAVVVLTPGGEAANGFSPYVDENGNIRVPEDYRTKWVFIGTWAVAGDDTDGGSSSLHTVYTQPSTVAAFRKTGKFPDGAVLVKELQKTKTSDMTTGRVSYFGEDDGWFIMVKDTKGRFEGNKLWGDGWGWSLFKAGDPNKTVTKNYKAECIPCHIPAKKDDWVYVRGYPVLHVGGHPGSKKK